ncbi:hypothetical protein P12x_004358 [Tundrisphaera lichenicola]|uniref:hypothetical protein n=1 Tax=Tundrisphaera lichenicola TaxID=2029860 RepID=UPI003EBC6810
MKIPRLALSLRTLMLGILVVAVILGYVAFRIDRDRKWDAITSTVLSQSDLSETIIREFDQKTRAFADALHPQTYTASGSGGPVTGPEDARWERELKIDCTVGEEPRALVNLKIGNQVQDFRLGPILIEDRGGELNRQLIEKLIEAFRKNNWPHRILPNAISATPTP